MFSIIYLFIFTALLICFLKFFAIIYIKNKKNIYENIISTKNEYYGFDKREWLKVYKFVEIGYMIFCLIVSAYYIIFTIIAIFKTDFNYVYLIIILPMIIIIIFCYKRMIIFFDLYKLGISNTQIKYSSSKIKFMNNNTLKLIINKTKKYYFDLENETKGNIINYYYTLLYGTIIVCTTILIIGIIMKGAFAYL